MIRMLASKYWFLETINVPVCAFAKVYLTCDEVEVELTADEVVVTLKNA